MWGINLIARSGEKESFPCWGRRRKSNIREKYPASINYRSALSIKKKKKKEEKERRDMETGKKKEVQGLQ